jgi:hypothetical protein
MMRSTHSARLEKWLGAEAVSGMTKAMQGRGWYGPPIAIQGVPGAVYITSDGDFIGKIIGGQEASALDRANDYLVRERRRKITNAGHMKRQSGAFASLSAIINAATGGKGQYPIFSKTGTASNAIGNAECLWVGTGQPVAGAASAAAPTGTSSTNATSGALKFANPTNANTAHLVKMEAAASVISNTLLLYDRLFGVAKTMNSTATEAVSGTFSRYQSGTATNEDYIGGNFVFPYSPTTVLAATAHNWTVCQYTDQDSNATQSIPSIAGVSASTVGGIDLVAGSWFMTLASGDVGVKALTQMQCSAAVATGTIDFIVGHPICFCPCPVANQICTVDGISTAFNLVRIYDNACLDLIEMPKPATTATIYSGQITIVAE